MAQVYNIFFPDLEFFSNVSLIQNEVSIPTGIAGKSDEHATIDGIVHVTRILTHHACYYQYRERYGHSFVYHMVRSRINGTIVATIYLITTQ